MCGVLAMAFTNFDTKEINCKVIYVGPAGAGKTANLRSIYTSTSSEIRSGLLELSEQEGPTRFFDFLPVSLGHVRDFHVKLHIFTMPRNTFFESVSDIILRGVDGYVFVADSRVESMADNIESLLELKKLLADFGMNPSEMPRVIQYNKRDVKDAVPLEIMRQELNRMSSPEQEAIAIQSIGTMETLQLMAEGVLKKLASQK